MSMQSSVEGLVEGKVGLVFGVAHKSSLAWAIAQSLHDSGMRLAITYQSERQERNARKLVDELEGGGSVLLLPCDVTSDEQIDDVFSRVKDEMGRLDTLVHSVAFANREDLMGGFSETSRDGFLVSQEISAFSLVALARRAVPLFEEAGGGSIITLTYLGGERVIRNYNMMGVSKASLEMCVRYLAAELGEKNIRVNAISAGPVKTLSARGVSGFTDILGFMQETAPLRRNIDGSEVGATALYLSSGLSSGMTGEVLHVDAGYHILGY
ncbi:MAG TPA: SDR family oxidoreductase [Acidobacteriota bacterium]|nr:SDR family oxidoreductase [Acidobacteriota bacterium]